MCSVSYETIYELKKMNNIMNIFFNNYKLFIFIVLVYLIVKFIINKVFIKIYIRMSKPWFHKYSLISRVLFILLFCALFACLTTIQNAYNFINFGDSKNKTDIVVELLTLYGIFYAFIQFAIGYASQTDKDKYWGQSKTKILLTSSIVYKIFLSSTFKVLLVFCSLYPIININENIFNIDKILILNIIKIEKNLIISFWTVSVFCFYVLYITLFLQSLVVMQRLFKNQERNDYNVKWLIEYDTIKSYKKLFLHYFYNNSKYYKGDNYFLTILNNDLNIAKFKERKIMVNKLIIDFINEHNYQQKLLISKINNNKRIRKSIVNKYYDKLNCWIDFFREFFLNIEKLEIDFNYEELLYLYKLRDKVIYNQIYVISCGDFNEILNYMVSAYQVDKYNILHNKQTIYFYIDDFIWNKIDTYDKLKKLDHYLLRRELCEHIIKKYYTNIENIDYADGEKIFLNEYNDYIIRVLDKCRDFQEDIKNNKGFNLFNAWEYNENNRRFNIIIQNKIFQYIARLEYNEVNKIHLEILIKTLDYKYTLALIFYIMLYKENNSYSKWKKDVLYLRNINYVFNDYGEVNTDDNINFVISTIKRSEIWHDNFEQLIVWIFANIYSELTMTIIDESNNLDFMSYTLFLKFKYIFHKHCNIYPVFLNDDTNYFSESKINVWGINYMKEILETPSLLKEDFFATHYIRFSEQLLKSCLYAQDNYILVHDFRFFYININFIISQDKFCKMIYEYSYIGKGITNFLILKIDDESYEYLLLNNRFRSIFIENVKRHVDKNKSIESYIDDLVNKANECTKDNISIIKRNRIVIKLNKLIYSEAM